MFVEINNDGQRSFHRTRLRIHLELTAGMVFTKQVTREGKQKSKTLHP